MSAAGVGEIERQLTQLRAMEAKAEEWHLINAMGTAEFVRWAWCWFWNWETPIARRSRLFMATGRPREYRGHE